MKSIPSLRKTLTVVRQGLKIAKKDKYYLYCGLTILISVFASLGLIFLKSADLPNEVPLFYSRPWGEPQLVSPLWLLVLPLTALLTAFVNFFWSFYLIEKENFLSKILVVVAAIFAFLSFYTLTRIVFLIS